MDVAERSRASWGEASDLNFWLLSKSHTIDSRLHIGFIQRTVSNSAKRNGEHFGDARYPATNVAINTEYYVLVVLE